MAMELNKSECLLQCEIMRLLNILFALSLFLWTGRSGAVVTGMELWGDNKNNTIITLADWHIDTLSVVTTFRQKKEIITLAKEINAYGIFEDVGWYDGNHPEILRALQWTRMLAYVGSTVGWLIPSCVENYFGIQTASPLFDLTCEAKKELVDCESVEFRYAGGWALLGYKIPLHDIYAEVTAKIQAIEKYADGDAMAKIYNTKLNSYLKSNKSSSDFFDYCCTLLDITILHALYNRIKEGKKTFIVYAGAAHIQAINYDLEAMDFTLKAAIGYSDAFGQQPSDEQARLMIKNALEIPEAYRQLINKPVAIKMPLPCT